MVTRQSVTRPLALEDAISVVRDYINTEVKILHQKDSQVLTLLDLLGKTATRKKVFDIALAAILKDNGIEGRYTVNTKDFKEFKFLTVQNPSAASRARRILVTVSPRARKCTI